MTPRKLSIESTRALLVDEAEDLLYCREKTTNKDFLRLHEQRLIFLGELFFKIFGEELPQQPQITAFTSGSDKKKTA